jgi:hypothetical protein
MLMATFAILLATAPVQAALVYHLSFDAPSYNVAPGGTVTTSIYLTETATNGSIPRLSVGGDNGLFSLGTSLNYATVVGGTGATIGSTANATINTTLFDLTSSNVKTLNPTTKVLQLQGFHSDVSVGIELAPSLPNVYQALLGTVSFQAGLTPGEQTTLTLSDFQAVTDDTVFVDATAIDGLIAYGAATINVAAVPEPATWGFIAAVVGTCLVERRMSAKLVRSK